MEFASASDRSGSFDGKVLLLVDLFINTLKPHYLGQVLDANTLCCFGSNAFDEESSTPSTELQVFGIGNLNIIQQRAPAALGREAAFAEDMAEWIKASNFSQVILLGSLDAGTRHGAQLENSQLRFLSTNEDLVSACQALGFVALEARHYALFVADYIRQCYADPLLPACLAAQKTGVQYEKMLLPPWPIYRRLGENGPPVVLLTTFAGEGEGNLRDAAELISYMHALLNGLGVAPGEGVTGWQAPVSWKHLFGTQRHSAIY